MICVSILLEGSHVHTRVSHTHKLILLWVLTAEYETSCFHHARSPRSTRVKWRWGLIILLSRSLFINYQLICLNEPNFYSVYNTWILIQIHKMTSKSEITLEHFYIFNGTYAKKEGEVSRDMSKSNPFWLNKLHVMWTYVFFLSGRKENIVLLSGKGNRCSNQEHRA